MLSRFAPAACCRRETNSLIFFSGTRFSAAMLFHQIKLPATVRTSATGTTTTESTEASASASEPATTAPSSPATPSTATPATTAKQKHVEEQFAKGWHGQNDNKENNQANDRPR